MYIYVNLHEKKTIPRGDRDMGGKRKTILALFIWAMAAVMFMAALHPNRT